MSCCHCFTFLVLFFWGLSCRSTWLWSLLFFSRINDHHLWMSIGVCWEFWNVDYVRRRQSSFLIPGSVRFHWLLKLLFFGKDLFWWLDKRTMMLNTSIFSRWRMITFHWNFTQTFGLTFLLLSQHQVRFRPFLINNILQHLFQINLLWIHLFALLSPLRFIIRLGRPYTRHRRHLNLRCLLLLLLRWFVF